MVAPALSFSGLVSLGDATVSFIGEGVIPEREAAIQRSNPLGSAVNIADGKGLDASEKPGVVLGRGLAENLGAKVGDSVVLVANGASGGIQAVELPVTGVFQTAAKAYDDTALRVTLPTAQTLLRVTGDHILVVLLDETRRTASRSRRSGRSSPTPASSSRPGTSSPISTTRPRRCSAGRRQS